MGLTWGAFAVGDSSCDENGEERSLRLLAGLKPSRYKFARTGTD
jgi:hypothetical protein